jgi:uncharacterized membrane protein (UPF0127 family)
MRPTIAMLASVASAMAALVGAECERVPPEDFGQHGPPSASTAAAPATMGSSRPSEAPPEGAEAYDRAAAADAGRCVRSTPRDPPAALPSGPAPGCPADPERGSGKLPVVRVAFPEAGGVAVEAELVRSEHDTMRGLMYRKTLGAERGMLFDLEVRDDHKFWMHNTCIPLDLLYIDEDGLLVGIVENAPTLDDTSRGVGCPSRWVLEVNAGWSRRHGVVAGQHVKLP